MLTVEGCRARQRRLVEALDRLGLAGALITHRSHVQYFTAHRSHAAHAPAAFLDKRGKLTLVAGAEGLSNVAADEIVPYPALKFFTTISDQARQSAAKLAPSIPSGAKLGVDLEGPGALARLAGPDAVDLTSEILRLRKKKDPDELALLRKGIDLCQTIYAYTKSAVKPGLDELELFGELRAIATCAAGGDLEHFGNDFQSNSMAGAPRRRPMLEGELYICDAGPSVGGYFADSCRTFAVDGEGTTAQHKACRTVIACLDHIESLAKPGITGQALYAAAARFLTEAGYNGLVHHLGHGIGLQAHEAPQLNPQYESVLEPGDVITVEPGVYTPELKAGIRLEQNYLVTANGVERLTTFPLELI
ncbi:MAG: putative cytoplasmic peptidase PepQ [Planctomycetota bacterium]